LNIFRGWKYIAHGVSPQTPGGFRKIFFKRAHTRFRAPPRNCPKPKPGVSPGNNPKKFSKEAFIARYS